MAKPTISDKESKEKRNLIHLEDYVSIEDSAGENRLCSKQAEVLFRVVDEKGEGKINAEDFLKLCDLQFFLIAKEERDETTRKLNIDHLASHSTTFLAHYIAYRSY